MFDRIFLIVMDSLGIGAMSDADKYGDKGANTLASVARAYPTLKLPTFTRLGLGNLVYLPIIDINNYFSSFISSSDVQSQGKDTTTGHWEIAGIVLDKPFALFPDGFDEEILNYIRDESGIKGFLGNKAVSGTEIIKELGDEHFKTRLPIIYTSADSVLQIAAHEEHFGLDKLYELCKIAREIADKRNIARVIARPFKGTKKENFQRTENRKDFSMPPPSKTILNILSENNVKTAGVGKIGDIFTMSGVDKLYEAHSNDEAYKHLMDLAGTSETEPFIFANLVDFDMIYGHRRNPVGYGKALKELDVFLDKWFQKLTPNTLVILTADHGCDPLFKGSDHTRERVPIIGYSPLFTKGYVEIKQRSSLTDIAATVLENFNLKKPDTQGRSFYKILNSLI